MRNQKEWDEYHNWDKEFCTDAAPTYWECWQAACATIRKEANRLDADFNDALIEINSAVAQVEELQEKLRAIGDFAHDKSAGPAVVDSLWERRNVAYEALKK